MVNKRNMSNWFKEFQCPLHPSWGLDDISELDLRQLKQNVDTDTNEAMVVETELYRAFLEYPCGRFYNQDRANPIEALKYLESAAKHVSTKYQDNAEAEIGYGIIIHTFHLWISADGVTEILLRDLIAKKNGHPKHESYIHVVHAYFLSRLGPLWRTKALMLYESALENFPNNCEWLFGKALMLGREARQMGNRRGWKDKNVQDIFQKEKGVLERILHLDPHCNLARAYYGQVLFSLGEKTAGTEISQALKREPQNCSIAMVAVRYYRRRKQFSWAEMILKRLLETSNTAETNHQLGLLYVYKSRSFPLSERFTMWKKALEYFDMGVKLNVCHFTCYTRRAEVYANLGETLRAYELFQEMFDHIYKDSPHLHQNEILTIETALEMRLPRDTQVFSKEEIVKLSHRYITLAIEQDGFNEKSEKVEKRLETLAQISCNDKDSIRRLATLKLADAYRLLERFEEAKQIYEKLYREKNIPLIYEADIIYGLAKCHFGQGFLNQSIAMASKLDRIIKLLGLPDMMNQSLVSASEIYADVYLKRAKSELKDKSPMSAGNIPLCACVVKNLELAIIMGSLEACYVFFNEISDLKEHFFSLGLRVPQILANINLLCENDSKWQIVHINFKMKLDDGLEIIRDEMIKRRFLQEKLNELLKYDYFSETDNPRNKKLKELEKIRKKRLEFEIHLIQRKENEEWNESCEKSLKEIVQYLRELLDHVICFYKKSVLKHNSGDSTFPVTFDKKDPGKVNTTVAKKKIDKWIEGTFPGYPGKLPDDIIERVLQVQPMYHSENLWLAALHKFNNALKHEDECYAVETFELHSEKPGSSTTWKSEDLVRKSCEEVEQLALYFLSKQEDSGGRSKIVPSSKCDDDLGLQNLFL